MAEIGGDEVERVIALARLALSEEEVAGMARDLGAILRHAESLAALDTEGVPPTAHVIPLAPPRREDSAVSPLDPEIAVANAPRAAGTAFVVPRVIEGEEEG